MKEFSKKLIFFFCAAFLIDLICALVWAWCGKDTTVFAYSIPATGAAAATSAAFYYNKAKIENVCKGKIKFLKFKVAFLKKCSPQMVQEVEKDLQMIDDSLSQKVDSEMMDAINESVEVRS